jgi:Glycosyl hydrolase family 20, catalytic domain
MVIDDAPRFVWRGVMIDVARHFYSLPTLKRQIDTMERVKLNILHLHLSDNEGFRVESRLYPKLHEGSSPEFYSQADIRELVSYAADRGVRIVPEFNVPGHSLGMLKAYPEYASGDVEGRDYFSAMGSALNPAKPDPQDPTACGLTHEQFAEGKAKGLPEAILAEDQVVDLSLKLSPVQRGLILGGEAALWTEIVSEQMLDSRLWPSAAVIAERLWSPASVRDPADMYRRLIVVHDGLRIAGLADEANRRRMAARLAPGKSESVELLLDLIAPVRNHAHNRTGTALLKGKKPTPQNLDELADAASPDSLVARRFELDAERFVRGDRSGAGALKATLASWRGNHDRFTAVARGNPQLEAALPISADIAALAGIGLDAIAAVESGRAPSADWSGRAKELLDRQAAAEKASESIVQVITMQQPPADLLISVTPGIRKLTEAAK